MYVFYKRTPIINEKKLVVDLDESRIEFILVFFFHSLCKCESVNVNVSLSLFPILLCKESSFIVIATIVRVPPL